MVGTRSPQSQGFWGCLLDVFGCFLGCFLGCFWMFLDVFVDKKIEKKAS